MFINIHKNIKNNILGQKMIGTLYLFKYLIRGLISYFIYGRKWTGMKTESHFWRKMATDVYLAGGILGIKIDPRCSTIWPNLGEFNKIFISYQPNFSTGPGRGDYPPTTMASKPLHLPTLPTCLPIYLSTFHPNTRYHYRLPSVCKMFEFLLGRNYTVFIFLTTEIRMLSPGHLCRLCAYLLHERW